MDLKAKVLLGRVFECQSERGNKYFRGRLGAARVVMFLDETSTADNPEWQIFVQNGDDKPKAEATPKPKRKRKAPAPKPPAGPLPFNDPLPI